MSLLFCCVIALLIILFYFKKLHSQLLISSGCSIFLALKALCKVRGGPSWCLTAPAESNPVLPLGCTGRATLAISAELQDLWLKSTHTYQKTSAISHLYLTWYIIWDSWHLGTSSSTDQRASLNPPCDGINPKTDMWMDISIIWSEGRGSVPASAKKKEVSLKIKMRSSFFLSFSYSLFPSRVFTVSWPPPSLHLSIAAAPPL